MILEPVLCPDCSSDDIVRHGRSSAGKDRYKCRNQECQRSTFVQLCQWQEVEAAVDEMWSFVPSKEQQRWLWHAIDHDTGKVLADVLSDHKDAAFVQLKALLEPFGITQFYSDDGGAYQRLLHPAFYTVGKTNTQTIEPKHLNLTYQD
jgi:insertion element IS1 protein InsB